MANENYIPIELDIDYSKATTSQDAFLKDMGKLKSSIIDLREENKKLNKEYKDTAKDASLSASEQIEKRKVLSQQIAKNEESLKKLGKQQRDNRTAAKAVDKTVDAYERQSAELTTLRKKIRAIQADGGIVKKADLDRADELDKKLKGIDNNLGQFFRDIGNYPGLDNLFGSLPGGAGGSVTDLLGNLKGLVNPVTAVSTAVIALTGYVAGVTLEYEKLQNVVTKTTGLQGEQARLATANAKAIADTYNQDFNEVVLATNSFAKQMGIDFDEAFDLVQKGFLNGADAQGDFLDNLKEYPAFIEQANLSAEDFVELQIRANREGIFSDKLIDAVKEADISLKEFTKTQRDALLPLGEQFADELERGIASGEVTTVEALTRIQKRSNEVGLNLRDTATITADIFKGAGEDAGGAAEVLEQVYATLEGSLADLSIEGDAYHSRQQIMYEASLNLALAESELASKFAGLGGVFAGSGDKIKTFFINILNDAIDSITETSRQISALWAGLKQLVTNIKTFDFSKSVSDAVNESYIASIERSNEAIQEQKESTKQLTAEEQKAIVQTRLAREEREKAAAARLKKINEIKAEILDLKDTLDKIPDEYKFEIVADIKKLETQLQLLGEAVTDPLAGGVAEKLPILDLIPDQIDSINDLRKDSDEKYWAERKEIVDENLKDEAERTKENLELRKQEELDILNATLDLAGEVAAGFARVGDARDQNELQALDEKYGAQIKLAEGNTERQEELQNELDQKKRKIEQRAFERSKRLQLIEATIAFQGGLTNILSAKALTVYDGPILKAIQVAALIAQYTSSIAAISSAKFAKGTVLKGDSHDKGGIQLFGKRGQHFGEAEGDETIVTKGASRNPKSLGVLSYVNQKYGGNSLGGANIPEDLRVALDSFINSGITRGFRPPAPPMRIYARGGVVQAQGTQSTKVLDPDILVAAVVEAVKGLTIITDVKDIIDSTEKYNTLLNSVKVA